MDKMKKLTKNDHFAALSLYLKEHPEIVFPTPKGDISARQMMEFAAHEIDLLTKKNSADKKPTAQQTANMALKAAILDGMEADKPYTVSDIIKAVPACADLSNQKVSSLMNQMRDAGQVIKTEEKRKSYFTKA